MANKPTILIVGASRGLGLALVEQFCGRHWHVIATVRRESAALDALKARFPASLEEETVDIADEARSARCANVSTAARSTCCSSMPGSQSRSPQRPARRRSRTSST
jgi:NAD(P)-dependent dehydrogenase (short-subunit alcohol dehydrogenase family)